MVDPNDNRLELALVFLHNAMIVALAVFAVCYLNSPWGLAALVGCSGYKDPRHQKPKKVSMKTGEKDDRTATY